MKKYIVQVTFNGDKTQIVTLKAKNNLDLEAKIAKELKNTFDDLKEINSIEYEKVKRFTFDKKDYHWFTGDTYVGGALLEKLLKDKSE